MKTYVKLDTPEILQFLFHPRASDKEESPLESLDIDIPVEGETTLGCRFYFVKTDAPTILYFHGNGETVSDYDAIAPFYNRSGLNLLMTTYRGYGWSTGSPTVTTMLADCQIIYDEYEKLAAHKNLEGPLFVMGRSIGSAAAIELCHHQPDKIKGLIIESGFADTLPLLYCLGLSPEQCQFTEEDGFGNLTKIAEIKLPTLILHGAADQIIPVPQAERLQAFGGARMKKFFVVPGADHNTMIVRGGEHYFTTIKTFTDEAVGKNTWRDKRHKYNRK